MTARRQLPAIASVLLLAGCAGTAAPTTSASPGTSPPPVSSSPAAPGTAAGQQVEVTVAAGRVSGDTGRVPVATGEQVTVVVTADVADEIHLHGYDLTTALTPGTPAELSFEATVPGVFEVELHDAVTVLFTLQVG